MSRINKNKIIEILDRPDTKPLKTNDLLKKLGLGKEYKTEIKKALRMLYQDGKINRLRGGRVTLRRQVSKKPDIGKDTKTARLIGKIQKRHNKYFFSPRDDKLPTIELKNSKKINLKNGSLIVLKVDSKQGDSHIERVLGQSGDISAEKRAIISEYNIAEKFSKKVVNEADNLPRNINQNDIRNRVDLRKKLFFTIDNDDARDFDDAVCINKSKSGYKLFVSIADVSHFVEVGSLIDKEARKRANSVYLPDKVYPMLPEVLSNNLCSLVPNEDRLTKTAEINYSADGSVKSYKIYNSVICSKARLTYSWVSDVVNNKGKHGDEVKQIIKALKNMKELFKKLKKKRLDKGELDFDFPEPELIRDENGKINDIRKSKRNIANGIIEEFMIATNNVVAEFIINSKTASIYRIHENPDIASIYELKQSLDDMGYKLNIGKKIKSKDIQKVIFDAKNSRDKNAVNMLILKSLKKAEYSTREIGHFGLALDKYTHFTSPIRRYPDLIVHRIIESLVSKNGYQVEKSVLNKISEHCSIKERLSDEIERESMDLERAYIMKERVGEEFNGTVISIMPFGMFIELDSIFVEGFVHRSEMRAGKKKRWYLVGQKVRVKIKESDVEKRRIRLSLV